MCANDKSNQHCCNIAIKNTFKHTNGVQRGVVVPHLMSVTFSEWWHVSDHVVMTCMSHFRFWHLLGDTCYPKGVAEIPLVTSFGRGYGRMLAIDGEVVMRHSWTNHSAMDLQPSFISEVLQIGGKVWYTYVCLFHPALIHYTRRTTRV